MSTSKNKLLNSLESYLWAVNDKIKNISLDDLAGSFKPIIFEKNVVIDADQVKEYDLKTLISNHSKYQLSSADVKVLIKDTDDTSKTYNLFVNSEEVITSSIDLNGVIKLHNTSSNEQTCIVKVLPPLENKNMLVFEGPTDLSADQVKQYDLKTLFPEWQEYQLMSADVKVLVKNKDSNSKTYNLFINSEAVINYGNDENGIVKVHNASNETQTVIIKITPPVEKN